MKVGGGPGVGVGVGVEATVGCTAAADDRGSRLHGTAVAIIAKLARLMISCKGCFGFNLNVVRHLPFLALNEELRTAQKGPLGAKARAHCPSIGVFGTHTIQL